jgi:hypothetical protein
VYLWDVLVELSPLVAATSFFPGGKKVLIRKGIQLVIAYFNILIVEVYKMYNVIKFTVVHGNFWWGKHSVAKDDH